MPSLLSRKPCLLLDNARPHTAHLIKFLLKDFKWKVFEHSPYLPDLALSEYHLFPRLKKELEGQWFATCEKLVATLECVLRTLDGWEARVSAQQMFTKKWRLQWEVVNFVLFLINIFGIFSTLFRFLNGWVIKLLDCPSYIHS